MTGKVLVLGNGSREHALAWKLSLSSKVDKVYVAPGNGGTANHSKISNLDINTNDNEEVLKWCKTFTPLLVIIGPEALLNQGIVDRIQSTGIPCFGPTAAAAQIECDKAFAKDFMARHNIPTAKYKVFTESTAAKAFARNSDFNALVVKASGLAAGKGVIIAANADEVCEQIDLILDQKIFGSAGNSIVLEEYLEGPEVSVLAFSDGKNFSLMPPAQDHKRAYDNDEGPNTGGMGAYAPCPLIDERLLEEISETVIKPTIDGLRKEGKPFIGTLYAGLMLTANGPKVLEFNCRFGDPETQVILPLLESDLFDICLACCTERLNITSIRWKQDSYAVGVVIANGGYPGKVTNGQSIGGLDNVAKERLMVFQAGTKYIPSSKLLVTNGGRLLTVVAIESQLSLAADKALKGAALVQIEGSFYRKDIAKKAVDNVKLDYKSSGVDIDAGNRLVENIKVFAANTSRSGVIDSIGGFGALFDLKNAGYVDPILVSGTDGVGTKLKIAIDCKIFDTVGIDLVAMCVNDILVQGAEPLYFLDYFACGKLDVNTASAVVSGISKGCKDANCALIGGETAEMPGMYAKGDFDLAGFAVGAVDRNKILPRVEQIENGDVVIGLSSTGVHSNGFSLVRKILQHKGLRAIDKAPFEENQTFGQVLLSPTKIYVDSLLPVIKSGYVKALAHITGGGLLENIPRILPKHLGVELNASTWRIPKIFKWIYKEGNVPLDEMLKTFNCGIGMICIIAKDDVNKVLNDIRQRDDDVDAYLIGHVVKKQEKQVIVNNFLSSLIGSSAISSISPSSSLTSTATKSELKKVAVLISGSGTTLQSLIDYTLNKKNESQVNIALVVSNVPDVEGLRRAEKVGIPTRVIPHQGLKRSEYDKLLHQELISADIEFVCLAGFMRILSTNFVDLWKGRLINIHPSLLPMFKGLHTFKQALDAGVRVHGTTVHFVDNGVDTGAIIGQEAVQILVNDTESTLQERVKKVEHRLFPQAVEHLVTGRVKLSSDGKSIWNI